MRPLKYRLTTLEDVKQYVKPENLIALDCETDGFYGKILLVQFYQAHWDEALLVHKPDLIELSALIKPLHIVCHNTSYEVSTMQSNFGEYFNAPTIDWTPKDWEDTLLTTKLQFYNKESYTLDECYIMALKFDPYTAHNLDKKVMQKADWSTLNEDKCKYAAIDVFYLLELHEKCKSWTEHITFQLDKAVTSRAFEFQTNGLPYNPERIERLRNKFLKEIKETYNEMRKIAPNYKFNRVDPPLNVNSWQQVRPFIGESESDALALATFALEGNKRAELVNKARKAIKLISFLDKYEREGPDGRIYGKFTFTTKSGRGNCKDQNLQQLPRKTKEVFEASTGNVFVISDFAQLELRMIGAITGDPTMERLFKENLDLHTYTAEMMGVPRQQAKTCNFNLGYGGSAKMLRSIFIKEANMLLPLETVAKLKKGWHELYDVLTKWQEDQTKAWRQKKAFKTILGRHFTAKLYTDAMNLPIQGSSAEVAKLAMHKMFKKLEENTTLKNNSRLCNFVHDSYIWECTNDPEIYEPLAKIVAISMKEAWEELVKHTLISDMPMPVDVKVGKNWGDLDYEKEEPLFIFEL